MEVVNFASEEGEISAKKLHSLLDLKLCYVCCLRHLNVRNRIYSGLVTHQYQFSNDLNGTLSALEYCPACLGIMNGLPPKLEAETYSLAKNCSVSETINIIYEEVKENGHEIADFCIEISLPVSILLRDIAIWIQMQEHFGLEVASGTKLTEAPIVSLKEAIKWMLIEPLSVKLAAVYNPASTFKISLNFSHVNSASEVTAAIGSLTTKRKRYGAGWGQQKNDSQNEGQSQSMAAVIKSLASMDKSHFLTVFPWPMPKQSECCSMEVLTWRSPFYVGGRYLKYSRTISQSPWLVDDERIGDGSVQELIADKVVPLFKADGHKFQSAGREDIDVRMLGNGRPFLLEILNARRLPSEAEIQAATEAINGVKPKLVGVTALQLVGSEATVVMREGETDKEKEYRAIVWLSREVTPADIEKLKTVKDLVVDQRTPIRVLHRRTLLTRQRTIYSLKGEFIPGEPNFFVLNLVTQAGTYIKEFVHGDFGRTYPNLGSILNCEADILQLDVTNIKMDFL